jgi:uncharacterized protein
MTINDDCVAPVLDQIVPVLRALKPYLYERWGITELAIFGSVARGEPNLDSDIDILFDYDRPLGLERVTLGDFLEEKLKNKVDLLSKKANRPQVWAFIGDEMCYI